MKPIALSHIKTLSEVAKKRGFAQSRLLTDWEKIIGQELAKVSYPLRISYEYQRNKEGILHLQVSSGWGLTFTHSMDLLLNRINNYFGYKAIGRIICHQTPKIKRNAKNVVKAREGKPLQEKPTYKEFQNFHQNCLKISESVSYEPLKSAMCRLTEAFILRKIAEQNK